MRRHGQTRTARMWFGVWQVDRIEEPTEGYATNPKAANVGSVEPGGRIGGKPPDRGVSRW